jgi:hypothetical protein
MSCFITLGYYLVNCPLTDEGMSSIQQNFVVNKEKSLFKVLSTAHLTSQQPINQSLVPALIVSHAVLYFCTIQQDIILNGTDLEVQEKLITSSQQSPLSTPKQIKQILRPLFNDVALFLSSEPTRCKNNANNFFF